MLNIKSAPRFLLVSIAPRELSDESILSSLKELLSLVESFGGVVEDAIIQKREIHDKGSYIGAGKIEEVSNIVFQKYIDVVVLNAIIKSGQLYDLKNILVKSNPNIEVWDKIDLILHIFSRHAKTAEARLQIEMASMRHMGPRIYGMGIEMSRQGGGIGTLGVGETNTELMKRHWRTQFKKAEEKLEKLTIDRKRQLERRSKLGFKTISIIGYTNAGKSSLFNILSRKKALVKNALFATLDSTVGKIRLPQTKREILVSDTIGFIRDLPPQLIEAFKSTLMESLYADCLIHVIDLSDPDLYTKITVVEQIIKDLKIDNKPIIYVFNKTDKANGLDRSQLVRQYSKFSPQFISVQTGEGVSKLLESIDHVV